MSIDPWEKADTEAKAPCRRFAETLKHAIPILKNADPRPGRMTKEQEAAQCSIVNAFLDLEGPQ